MTSRRLPQCSNLRDSRSFRPHAVFVDSMKVTRPRKVRFWLSAPCGTQLVGIALRRPGGEWMTRSFSHSHLPANRRLNARSKPMAAAAVTTGISGPGSGAG